MDAVVVRRFGPPEVLVPEVVPDPEPAAGEVLIDVAVAGVTFVETQLRAGRPPIPGMAPDLPVVLGNGVGGTVAAAGPDADPGLVGTRVVTGLNGRGGYASRAVAGADRLVPVPDGLDLDVATALLADGRTALLEWELAAARPGETVLVEAAAGGVGALLVQLARRDGVRVVAAAGGPVKVEAARALGADLAVDYREPGWADAVRAGSDGVDVVLDGVGGDVGRAAYGLLGSGGRFLPYGGASGTLASVPPSGTGGIEVRGGDRPSPERLLELTRQAVALGAAGELRPLIGARRPLPEAARAHADMEARRTVGKTLLEVR